MNIQWPDREKIRKGLIKLLHVNMGLRKGERLLFLSDIPTSEQCIRRSDDILKREFARLIMVKYMYEIVREEFKNNTVDFHVYLSRGQSGKQLNEALVEKMLNYDVIIAPTSYSLSHTNGRKKACSHGARIASMPGFEAYMLEDGGPLDVNYEEMAEQTQRFADLLTKAYTARVMCPEGTDITFSLEGRSAMADTGFYRNKEQWGNLPAGEACIAPLEGTAAGKIVIKKECFEGIWEDMTLIFDKGMVTDIRSTGKTLQKYQELLMQDNPHKKYQNRRNLAELGIGTNPIASNPLLVLEAEKIKGTVHLAIGTSAFLGGTVKTDIHQDFVIKKPTVKLFMDRNDEKGTVIMENGEWKI